MEHYTTPVIPLCKTEVFHDGKCYFVSTIDRESSATEGPRRFSETFVFACDDKNKKVDPMIHEADGPSMCLNTHYLIVEKIFKNGIFSLTVPF